MSTIADYSVFTKAFLASKDVDFSKLYTTVKLPNESGGEVEALRAFAVVPMDLGTALTTRGALNLDTSSWAYGDIKARISCRDADGKFIGNIVRVQPGVREGSIRLVAKVAVPAAVEEDVSDISVNTFVLLRANSTTKVGENFSTNVDLPIAVATISKGYTLHKHLASEIDPLDDVENANYVSFTINNLNGYTSVDFNPDAYATYDDVSNALSRSIDGLHIAFDTASGDLKLLDKDGNVLDQANLPIKADVIIADGEEGYKYVKTDVKQDIHAAKAWMPEGKTAWETVPEAPYAMKKAALVVEKGSSRVFVCTKPFLASPISTKSVPLEHVVIDDSTYMLTNKTETTCDLHKVKGEAGEPFIHGAGISDTNVTLNNDQSQSYPITNGDVKVDVIEYEGVTYVLAGTDSPNEFLALYLSGEQAGKHVEECLGTIVTFGGSTTASRVFVDPNSGSFPISTESVQLEHVVIDGSTYMLVDKNETTCDLHKVKGEAGEPFIYGAGISGTNVTLNNDQSQSYPITNGDVKVDVIKAQDSTTTHVIVGTDRPNEFRALPIDGTSAPYWGPIVTFEGSSTGEVLGITPDGTNLYTFDEGAQPHSEINNISGGTVRWLDRKPLNEVPNYTLKYGLEAFVWTVKDREVKLNEPFFQQLNDSLIALGFHEGDDIALGTNLSILAPTEGVSPLNKVDADEYIHGKANKATREQEVDEQRKLAKEELVAWNAQHPVLTQERSLGTIIDSSGLDVRNGSITLGCGRVGAEGVSSFQKVNYGIQMKDRSRNDNIPNRSESLDFTISHFTGSKVQFDDDGHAAQLFSSTLLSIEPSSYISGAPTCLILAEVTHNSDPNSVNGPTVFTPVRMTAGFSVAPSYSASDGLRLTLQDYRDNILSLLNPNLESQWSAPAIIEVQAIYTHPNAETVPAQQMHTYIGEWSSRSAEDIEIGHPECRFFCNKIEEWMTAIGLADTNPAENVKLYVVIRVY